MCPQREGLPEEQEQKPQAEPVDLDITAVDPETRRMVVVAVAAERVAIRSAYLKISETVAHTVRMESERAAVVAETMANRVPKRQAQAEFMVVDPAALTAVAKMATPTWAKRDKGLCCCSGKEETL